MSFTNFRCIYECNVAPLASTLTLQDISVDIPFWLVSTLYSDDLEITQPDGSTSVLRIVLVATKAFKGATFAFSDAQQQETFLQVLLQLHLCSNNTAFQGSETKDCPT